jgi:hypothetical protein
MQAGQRRCAGGFDWSNTFMADTNGTLTIDFDVTASGEGFNLQGWGIDWFGSGRVPSFYLLQRCGNRNALPAQEMAIREYLQ